jgi:hypothetical protein
MEYIPMGKENEQHPTVKKWGFEGKMNAFQPFFLDFGQR